MADFRHGDTANWDTEQVRRSEQSRQQTPARKKRKKRKRINPFLYILFVLVTSAVLAYVGWMIITDLCAFNKDYMKVEIEVTHDDTVDTVAEKLEEAGLIPFAMSGHTNLMDTDRIPDFVKNIRLAHFFGAKYIVSSIGEAHLKDNAVASNEVVAEHIKGFLPYLEKYDMILVLEVHGEHGTGVILKEIANLVDSPRVLVNYDTANAIFYGDVDVPRDFAASLDKIGYVHLKEKAGGRQEWDFPALGKGYVEFPEIFAMLDEADNLSPFSIEIEFTQAGPKDLDEINKAVADSAEYLRAQGFEF